MDIKFSKNWNRKLDCDYFTTIRLGSILKQKYYRANMRQVFDVKIKGQVHSRAILSSMQVTKLGELRHQMIFTDSGMGYIDFCELMRKLYGERNEWNEFDTPVLILLFKKTYAQSRSGENNGKE